MFSFPMVPSPAASAMSPVGRVISEDLDTLLRVSVPVTFSILVTPVACRLANLRAFPALCPTPIPPTNIRIELIELLPGPALGTMLSQRHYLVDLRLGKHALPLFGTPDWTPGG